MISKIDVQNFKSLLDHSLDFRQLTILAGANSVGKSSVIQCLLLIETSLNGEGEAEADSQISLNGQYLLSLGAARSLISDDAREEQIKFQIHYNDDCFINIIYGLPPGKERFLLIEASVSKVSTHIRQKLHYLNAERIGPRVRYEMKNYDLDVGFQGEYTIDVLAKHGQTLRLAENKCFPNDAENNTLRYQVQKWMNFVLPGVEINASIHAYVDVAQMDINSRTPPNVGFGISYVLPIIVSGLIAENDSLLIIENPEAHLHPYGQSRMGQFLVKMAGGGVQIVVETHSEHIINGMCLGTLKGYLSSNDIIINFFDDKPSKKLNITPISITEEGDLDKWPTGFFDQQEKDLIEINKLKRQRKV